MVPLLAHHEVVSVLGSAAVGLSGVTVAVLWTLATHRPRRWLRGVVRRDPDGRR